MRNQDRIRQDLDFYEDVTKSVTERYRQAIWKRSELIKELIEKQIEDYKHSNT